MASIVKLEVLQGHIRLYFEQPREAEEYQFPIASLPELVAELVIDVLKVAAYHDRDHEVDVEPLMRAVAETRRTIRA